MLRTYDTPSFSIKYLFVSGIPLLSVSLFVFVLQILLFRRFLNFQIFFFLIAFCSATHDISADGFYMIELDEHNQTKFVGLRNTFYRLAIIFVNGFLVMLAGVLQVMFRNQIRFSWALIFYGLAGIFIGLWLYHSRLMPTPKEDVQTERTVGEVTHELKNMFRTFFTKFGARETVIVMLFLLFYRFPEALLNTMTKTFILRPNSQGFHSLFAANLYCIELQPFVRTGDLKTLAFHTQGSYY